MLAVAMGVVHPVRGGWYFDQPLRWNVGSAEWMISIRQSQFHVFISGERPTDLATFLNQVASMVQGCLDALSFHLAIPLRAEVLSMVMDGKELVYRSDQWQDLLDEENKMRAGATELAPVVAAAATNPTIRLALADLRAAIEPPDDTVMLCYRAIEGVRRWFLRGDLDEGSARKQSWIDMRAALDFDETRIRSLERLALERRHGGIAPTAERERIDALKTAREIVHRLIAHYHEVARMGDI